MGFNKTDPSPAGDSGRWRRKRELALKPQPGKKAHRAKSRTGDRTIRVLVGTGAGFLGSHLCDRSYKAPRLLCVDNFYTGTEASIRELTANKAFRFSTTT